MVQKKQMAKVAFLGNFPPHQCGIATFTRDLHDAVTDIYKSPCPVITVTQKGGHYDYPDDVRFELLQNDVRSYLRAAEFLNLSNATMLCVQHEFGIYGGAAGGHLISLLKRVRMPIITTLHTVLQTPNADQRRVFENLINLSARLVVMTEKGAEILTKVYGVPDQKIEVIPHGIPDVPFIDPNFYKDQFRVAGRQVILTFGLLSPNKGIEYGIQALPDIVKDFPNVVYIILGATHPNLVRDHGETYRLSLESLARRCGVERNVMFVNSYIDNQTLMEYIGATDIYLTPYLHEQQVTSGTLAYCFGAGKVVVSTPYWHAAELLDQGRGVLVPFRDADAIALAIKSLLTDEPLRHAMRKEAYLIGREMVWRQVGMAYIALFEKVLLESRSALIDPLPVATLANEHGALPLWRFDHLLTMTDSTGILQHATHSIPNFNHGYCTDDNARALLLTAWLEDTDCITPEVTVVQRNYAAFLQHAFVDDSKRFRNFLSFDRRWQEDSGSEDSHGRALWALGAIVGRTSNDNLRNWAARLLEKALPASEYFSSPRAWAFIILGLNDYLKELNGDLYARRQRDAFAHRLLQLFERNTSVDWPWLEDIVTYDNARIAQALIATGHDLQHKAMLQCGLSALTWLQTAQTGVDGCFRPIGSEGFWKRGEKPAVYDQQPIEATAAVSACIEAFHVTGDIYWHQEATRSFEWFLGHNDFNITLYHAGNGGCFDGLQPHQINQNQGAESTLSFYLALAGMNALNHTIISSSQSKKVGIDTAKKPQIQL